jgi:hypothetical protein
MAEGRRRHAGGIVALAELFGEHRGAFEYDWRTRFGLPLTAVPSDMGWDEALRMLKILSKDPSSHVQAALAKWQFPTSWEYIALADLIDLQAKRTKWRKQPKPYRRPWDRKPVAHGAGQAVSIDEWKRRRAAALAKHAKGGEPA